MYGQIPHRLPGAPAAAQGDDGEAEKGASAGREGIDDGFADDADKFRSDFAAADSEEGRSASASSSSGERDSPAVASGDRGLTEEAGSAAPAAETTTGGAEVEERVATTAAGSSDTDASTSTPSTSTTTTTPTPPPPPRPSWPPPRRPKKTYPQLQLPSPEQMAQEEAMNNCGVRTVLSGVMGAGLGVVFGIFMGTMDMAGVRFAFFPFFCLSFVFLL